MIDEEILTTLRNQQDRLSAVELAKLLERLNGELSQSVLIAFFHRAFPSIPLRVLLDAGAWHRISGGGLHDEGFNSLINPWLVDKDGKQ